MEQAQLMLGRYLADGAAGEFNREEAREWLERAVEQGVSEAETDLADLKTVLSASIVAFASNRTGLECRVFNRVRRLRSVLSPFCRKP